MKKLIFLDIDGVLNSQNSFKDKKFKPFRDKFVDENHYHAFYPEYKDNLNKLILKHNADIVISSTWRKYSKLEGMQKIWLNEGMPGKVVGITPDLPHGFRGLEIDAYLSSKYGRLFNVHQDQTKVLCEQEDFSNYVIIDDDGDMTYYQRHNFCHTRNKTGFNQEAFERADEILSRNLWDIYLF